MIAIAVLLVFALAILAFYTIDLYFKSDVDKWVLEIENQDLDAGRKSWRAEAKHRRKRMAEQKETINALHEINEMVMAELSDSVEYSMDLEFDIAMLEEQVEALEKLLKEATKQNKKTKPSKAKKAKSKKK